MTISEVSPTANVVLDGSGNGRCFLSPPTGTKWALRLATLSTSTATKHPQGSLYRGSASGPLQLVDSTLTGDAASSAKIGGAIYYAGQGVWAVWSGGDAGATATLQLYGQQGGRLDPLADSPPGEGFANQKVLIAGELDVGVTPNPRVVISTTIPATLVAGSADFSWTAVKLMYFDATTYYWEAIGTFVGTGGPYPIYGNGTYDATHGVIYNEFEQGIGGPNPLFLFHGSDVYNGANLLTWAYRNGNMGLSSTTNFQAAGTAQAVAIKALVSGLTETWHPFGLLNSFTNRGAGFPSLSYRMVAAPANSVEIKGQIVSGATVASGTQIAALPAGYLPITEQVILAQDINTAAGLQCAVETTGHVMLFGTWANTHVIQINGFIALDL